MTVCSIDRRLVEVLIESEKYRVIRLPDKERYLPGDHETPEGSTPDPCNGVPDDPNVRILNHANRNCKEKGSGSFIHPEVYFVLYHEQRFNTVKRHPRGYFATVH